VREQLEKLIGEMVDRGILYVDAQREFERRFIVRVLARCDGNLSRAAAALGIHRNTLSRKMAELHLRKKAQG
jgi:DNA-binding NtrC family response regulator